MNESWRDIVVILMRALTFTHESFAGFANWIALTGIIASVVGIAFGAMADRAGRVKVLFIFILLRMVGFVVFAYTEEYWPNDEYFKAMMLAEGIMSQFVTITVIALFMRLCLPQVAATQFAVYMALANLTRSIGSGVVVPLGGLMDYSQMFLVMAGLHVVFLLLLPLLNFEKHERDNAKLFASLGKV